MLTGYEWIILIFVPAVSVLIGSFITFLLSVRQLSIQQRNAFVEKQLAQFYSPLAAWRKRIRALSELRVKVHAASNAAWQELCQTYSDQPMLDHEERFAPYRTALEYSNEQFHTRLMPLYRQMLDTFTEKYWLADEDTRSYYNTFLEFVELWERHLAEAVPPGVIERLDHAEENLKPFYEHVEQRLQKLQDTVADRKRLTARSFQNWTWTR